MTEFAPTIKRKNLTAHQRIILEYFEGLAGNGEMCPQNRAIQKRFVWRTYQCVSRAITQLHKIGYLNVEIGFNGERVVTVMETGKSTGARLTSGLADPERPLTPDQYNALNMISRRASRSGKCPTNKELMDGCGWGNESYGSRVIRSLTRLGYITTNSSPGHRNITVVSTGHSTIERNVYNYQKKLKREMAKKKMRKCLGRTCGKMFMSHGIGNRICSSCRKSPDWRSVDMGGMMAW